MDRLSKLKDYSYLQSDRLRSLVEQLEAERVKRVAATNTRFNAARLRYIKRAITELTEELDRRLTIDWDNL